jgi:hypothetical protein
MKVIAVTIVLALLVGFGVFLLRSKLITSNDAKVEDWPPEVIAKVNRDRAARESVKKQNPQLFAAVSNAMFLRDPIGINFETNADEYEAEAGTVIPRLETCSSSDDVVVVLHEEFVRWFGVDTAGDRSRYVELAKDIWALWQQRVPNSALQGTPASGAPELHVRPFQ